ncbi:MAG: hypothetical protein IPO31_08035 [Candidatus Obscuribacter sp.]|nr:hypothetical protein [Candidatus Obscuribacter sp.]
MTDESTTSQLSSGEHSANALEETWPDKIEVLVLKRNPWLSLGFGLITGIFLHYMLFRLSLPTEPFIYAAF